jgi:hypothetical protein
MRASYGGSDEWLDKVKKDLKSQMDANSKEITAVFLGDDGYRLDITLRAPKEQQNGD